jgi:beta-lactam-binding protein with PASTA domain
MKFVIALVVAVVLMAVAGWLTFSDSKDRATINVETQEMKEDTREAVRKGNEFSEKDGEKTREILKDATD